MPPAKNRHFTQLSLRRAYTDTMPGSRRVYHPKSPVTIAALLVLLFILIWVVLSQTGLLR